MRIHLNIRWCNLELKTLIHKKFCSLDKLQIRGSRCSVQIFLTGNILLQILKIHLKSKYQLYLFLQVLILCHHLFPCRNLIPEFLYRSSFLLFCHSHLPCLIKLQNLFFESPDFLLFLLCFLMQIFPDYCLLPYTLHKSTLFFRE